MSNDSLTYFGSLRSTGNLNVSLKSNGSLNLKSADDKSADDKSPDYEHANDEYADDIAACSSKGGGRGKVAQHRSRGRYC